MGVWELECTAGEPPGEPGAAAGRRDEALEAAVAWAGEAQQVEVGAAEATGIKDLVAVAVRQPMQRPSGRPAWIS